MRRGLDWLIGTAAALGTLGLPAATAAAAPPAPEAHAGAGPRRVADAGGVANPACVPVIQSGESLSLIADAVDQAGVSVASLQAENLIADPDLINRGGLLDICVGNSVDDVTGDPRTASAPPAATAAPAPAAPIDWSTASGVEAQQQEVQHAVRPLRHARPRCRRRLRPADPPAAVRRPPRPRPAGEPQRHGAGGARRSAR